MKLDANLPYIMLCIWSYSIWGFSFGDSIFFVQIIVFNLTNNLGHGKSALLLIYIPHFLGEIRTCDQFVVAY